MTDKEQVRLVIPRTHSRMFNIMLGDFLRKNQVTEFSITTDGLNQTVVVFDNQKQYMMLRLRHHSIEKAIEDTWAASFNEHFKTIVNEISNEIDQQNRN